MQEIIEKLKLRYPNIHPLIFHRSVERAKTPGELFEYLEGFPSEYPIIWQDGWKNTKDLLQYHEFQK